MHPKIKFSLILAVLVIGIATLGYFKAIPKAENQKNIPKIEIAPEAYDFGTVDFGKVMTFDFQVKNRGNEILEIKRVATSCACTTANISQEKINPGETAKLSVSYDTAAMGRSSHGTGEQERIIYVKSSDPITPQVEVTIYAYVK